MSNKYNKSSKGRTSSQVTEKMQERPSGRNNRRDVNNRTVVANYFVTFPISKVNFASFSLLNVLIERNPKF